MRIIMTIITVIIIINIIRRIHSLSMRGIFFEVYNLLEYLYICDDEMTQTEKIFSLEKPVGA